MDSIIWITHVKLTGEIESQVTEGSVKTDSNTRSLLEVHPIDIVEGISNIIEGGQPEPLADRLFDLDASNEQMLAAHHVSLIVPRSQRFVVVSAHAVVAARKETDGWGPGFDAIPLQRSSELPAHGP